MFPVVTGLVCVGFLAVGSPPKNLPLSDLMPKTGFGADEVEPKGFPKADLEIGVRVEVAGFVVAPATFLNKSGVSTAGATAEEPPKILAGCEGAAEKEENTPDFGGAGSLELKEEIGLFSIEEVIFYL